MVQRGMWWSWFAACVAVVALAAVMRFADLNLRVFHGDESVNTTKFNQLYTGGDGGQYHYDPHEYHGPSLLYLTYPAAWLSGSYRYGDTDEAFFRRVTATFGVALVVLTLMLGRAIGRAEALAAALLVAISPSMVFYSRYYIHEMLLVTFTAAALLAAWRHIHAVHAGRRDWLWATACGACIGAMHATKETFVLVLAAAFTAAAIKAALRAPDHVYLARKHLRPVPILSAILAGGVVAVSLFSKFFTDRQGPIDSWMTYLNWVKLGAGIETPHVHPWHWYLSRLAYVHDGPGPAWSEGLILALGCVGIVVTFMGRGVHASHRPMARFFAIYTPLLIAIYSLIPYKTPWCSLGFVHGMTVLAGVGAVAMIRAALAMRLGPVIIRRVAAAAIALALAAGAWQLCGQAYRASFVFHTDRRNPYVYGHAVPGIRRLAERITVLAKLADTDRRTPILVVDAASVWPLPYYLRRLPVDYQTIMPAKVKAPIVVVAAELEHELAGQLDPYQTEHYGLRSGEMLLLHVDPALWKKFRKSIENPNSQNP